MSNIYTDKKLSGQRLKNVLEFTLENGFYNTKGFFGDIVCYKRVILYDDEEVDLMPALLSIVTAMYMDKETKRRLSVLERRSIKRITNPYSLKREEHLKDFMSKEKTKQRILELADRYDFKKLLGDKNFKSLEKIDDHLDYLESQNVKLKQREYKLIENDEAPNTLITVLNSNEENSEDSYEYTLLAQNSGIEIKILDDSSNEERTAYGAKAVGLKGADARLNGTTITFFERKNEDNARFFTLAEQSSHEEDSLRIFSNILIQKAQRKNGRKLNIVNTHHDGLREIIKAMAEIHRVEIIDKNSQESNNTRPGVLVSFPSKDNNGYKIA